MSHVLTLELPEEVAEALSRAAARAGQGVEEWAASRLSQAVITESERAEALERLLKHAGAVDLGHPTGTHNEQTRSAIR